LALSAAALGLILALVSLIYFGQHSMIYHPRPYDSTYAHALPSNGVEINYTLLVGKQTAYYIPGPEPLPKRLWIAFCGNGSLALDWVTILRGYPDNGDAFLLVDYPGYGKNAGYATIDNTRAGADAAVRALIERLHVHEEQLALCTIGHSLGSAVALDFAAHHRVQRIVAIAPFTTLREEAATIVGRLLARLLIENYDNRTSLGEIAKRNPRVRIAIFHGVDDGDIPERMGGELAHEFPFIEFFPIDGADHMSALTRAQDKIIDWMNRSEN
jgi:pimeloyl-ACP methyl ester carboxylesterase